MWTPTVGLMMVSVKCPLEQTCLPQSPHRRPASGRVRSGVNGHLKINSVQVILGRGPSEGHEEGTKAKAGECRVGSDRRPPGRLGFSSSPAVQGTSQGTSWVQRA